MLHGKVQDEVFGNGDEVVLTAGTYEGTPGVFLRLKDDLHWADMVERNGSIRSHPVAWLAHIARDSKVITGVAGT